jgi:DNA-binding NarL/FixJ family response regulator
MPDVKTAQRSVRVVLVDDHLAMRQGLALLLSQEGLQVCGEAANRAETISSVETGRPDIVLMDISLGEESGLDLIADVVDLDAKVLCYSMFEDAATIRKALHAGALGYVTKREMADCLLAAVASVLAGDRHLSPVAAQSLSADHPDQQVQIPVLSRREQQIVALIGRGLPNMEIATTLNISIKTVEAYCSRIMDKLDLHGMREIRQYAIRNS